MGRADLQADGAVAGAWEFGVVLLLGFPQIRDRESAVGERRISGVPKEVRISVSVCGVRGVK
jgi:hypothetical protein